MQEDAAARRARVLALCEAPIPSAVLGVHAVFAALADAGLCELRTGSSVRPDAGDLGWADVLVLVRGASPSERRLLDEAKRLGKRVATYLDDDLERVPASARSGYFFTSSEVRGNVARIIAGADEVLVCSQRLGAEIEARHGRRPLLVLQPRPPRLPDESTPRPRAGAVRVGFLGSVDHARFLDELLAAPLRRLRDELGPRIELVFCGALPEIASELGAECHPFEIDFSAWRRTALGLGLAIGLAPMADTPFDRLKYWNKYLEYGSLGVAGIYSAHSPNADVVREGETGLVRPNEPEAWYDALRRLITDDELRERIAGGAYDDVESRFSSEALLPRWTETLSPLLSHRAPACSLADVRVQGGMVRHALDRMAIYGPLRFTERVLGRLTGRLRWG